MRSPMSGPPEGPAGSSAVGGAVLAVVNAWPPMAAGTGRAVHGMLSDRPDTVVLAPRAASVTGTGRARVLPVFRFSLRARGPFKVYSALQHLEMVVAPLVWCAGRKRERRPSVIVAIQPLFAGVGALLVRHWFRIPFVVLVHGEELTTWRADRGPFQLRHRLLGAVLGAASAVVCNSIKTRQLARELYGVPDAKLHVIYPAVAGSQRGEPGPQAAAALRKRFVGPKDHLVLMVGRLGETHKGFDTAIEALPLILAEEPGAHLVMVGPGDQSSLRELAHARGVAERVHFAGLADEATLAALFAACDLFLLPGREVAGSAEGFGVVFLEAALAGKAVVGGRVGGVPDAVVDGETGLLVDGGSSAEVARAVVRLLCDPALATRLGAQGRRRALMEFDGRRQHEQFEQVLRAVSPIGPRA
jgi:phosphatidylinositol alpha-1,6-mannosyltransferase